MKYTMKKGKVTGSVFFIGLIILIFGCSQDDSISPPLAGQVLDVYSNEPIENIKISILENGPVTYTDSKGNFAFSSADLGSLDHEEIEVNGFSGVAISLTHEDFRFRETNLNFNEKNIFKVIGASVPAYAYTEPVQLNDGLNISSLEEAGVDNQAIQNVMDKVYRDDYKEIHSILVFKDDRLVIEEYFFGNNDTIQFEEGIIVDHNPDHIQWSRKEKRETLCRFIKQSLDFIAGRDCFGSKQFIC